MLKYRKLLNKKNSLATLRTSVSWFFFLVSIAYTFASFLCKYIKEKIQTVLVAGDFVQGCCFYSRMQIRPVILVLFVILLSEKNRIMRNLCTSLYNFIMFVYLFVFLDMRLILITHTGNFDNILIIGTVCHQILGCGVLKYGNMDYGMQL